MISVKNKQFNYTVEGDRRIKQALAGLLKGKFFKVEFLKADGSKRNMNGRMGVGKFVKGTGRTPPEDSVIMYIPALKAYRSFKLNKMISISCGKVQITGEAA